jgi:hypothetical protein
VKKFVFLTYGFKPPTPEIMTAWGRWFETVKDNIVEMGHLSGGREISKAGAKDLPMDLDAITGLMIVRAANREEAEKLARGNPYISSIRFYELMTK